MARTALEDRQQILDDLAQAIASLALAVACLGEAFEQLDTGSADRLEAELFRPTQKAYGRAKRGYAGFAQRHGLPTREFESPSPGVSSQGVKVFVERAVSAAAEGDHHIAGLQDSMLPIESGDAELRAALSEIRELLAELPVPARQFL